MGFGVCWVVVVVRCLVCGVWCLVWGVWCVVCGVWCAVCGVRCAVWGVRGAGSGEGCAWSEEQSEGNATQYERYNASNPLCHNNTDEILATHVTA